MAVDVLEHFRKILSIARLFPSIEHPYVRVSLRHGPIR